LGGGFAGTRPMFAVHVLCIWAVLVGSTRICAFIWAISVALGCTEWPKSLRWSAFEGILLARASSSISFRKLGAPADAPKRTYIAEPFFLLNKYILTVAETALNVIWKRLESLRGSRPLKGQSPTHEL
jgi:hypothetical protein